MSKWHLFYNILGVDDNSGTPEATKLLGVTSCSYSKLDVINAFENTQKKLRRNIHDKKHLRSLLEFEKKILTPAMNELLENAALQSEILGADTTDNDSLELENSITLKKESKEQDCDSYDSIEIILSSIDKNEDVEEKDSSEDDYSKAMRLLRKDKTSIKDKLLKFIVIFAVIIALCMISILAVLLHKTFIKLANRYQTNVTDLIDSKSDQFQQDDTKSDNSSDEDASDYNDSGNINQEKSKKQPGQIRNSEAIFSKLRKSKEATTELTLNKTASALISCCDRIAKIDNRNETFRKQLKVIGLDRKLESGSINISLTKLNISRIKSFNRDQISTLKKMLYRGSQEDKKLAIARLSRIGNKQALSVLLNRLRRGYNGNDSRAIISRLIYTLCEWDENSVKIELAKFIGECPSARLASEISLKLMISTGITVDGDGQMPLKNNDSQRNACSIWWQRKLQNFHKKKIATITLSDPNSIRETYNGGISNLRGIAINATFIEMLANQLEAFSWQSQKEAKYKFVDCSNITVSQISEELTSGSKKIALEFLRIAREYNPSKKDNIELDIINLERRARVLACNSALQESVANIHSAAQTLIVLNSQFDVDGVYKKALEEFKLEMTRDSVIASTSLEQLQQECYYTLRMLDLLRQQTRGHKYKRN